MSHVVKNAPQPLNVSTHEEGEGEFSFFNTKLYCVANRLFLEHPTKWKIVCVERRQWLRQSTKFSEIFNSLGKQHDDESVRTEAGKSFARIFFAFLGALSFDPSNSIWFKMYLKLF